MTSRSRWITNLAAAGAAIVAEEHAIEEALHIVAVKVTSGQIHQAAVVKDGKTPTNH